MEANGERDGLASGRKRAGDVGDRGARISPSPLVSNNPPPPEIIEFCALYFPAFYASSLFVAGLAT